MTNRLAQETSPYLLQHKDNPVDWYPWSDEALAAAKSQDKPILLSVGYAACHWCHVMERESFEDPATAALMNEHFVAVKVDREERPDLDAIYMDAVQAMTGSGGWPMTVFLTPDGVPFYGGTYFPPEERHGLPSFKKLLLALAGAWRSQRDQVESQAEQLLSHIEAAARVEPAGETIAARILDDALEVMQASFDEQHGGFGRAPKFPQPMNLDLCMRLSARGSHRPGAGAEAIAVKTLTAMARGGICDQLGGGFHRYSVDRAWVVPHFEKMLYDNAQLIRSYALGWQLTKDTSFRTAAEGIAQWLLSEMLDPAGGFHASMDADSEGVEGKFYVWDYEAVLETAGADADAAVARWGFTPEGNFDGANIPVWANDDVDEAAVERARGALLATRARRVRPATDTKVLTSWNGLAVAGLAEAGVIFGRPEWVAAAVRAMAFVLSTLRVDGRLMRSYRDGSVKHLGYCEDYAATLAGCLALYEATFDPAWIDEATRTADDAVALFADRDGGGFFVTGEDAQPLITRQKDLIDNAVPSANSIMALELQRLALFTGVDSYERIAEQAMRAVPDQALARSPLGFGHLLSAVDFYTSTPLEIVIVGDPSEPDARRLVDSVHEEFIANKIVLASHDPASAAARIPLFEGRARLDGKATAFVCRRGTCRLPVTDAEALMAEIGAA